LTIGGRKQRDGELTSKRNRLKKREDKNVRYGKWGELLAHFPFVRWIWEDGIFPGEGGKEVNRRGGEGLVQEERVRLGERWRWKAGHGTTPNSVVSGGEGTE